MSAEGSAPRLPNFLVINRFADEDADYARYLGDTAANVTVITISEAVRWLPRDPRFTVIVIEEMGEPYVLACAAQLLAEGYRCDGVVALSEYDVVVGAQVRDLLGAPGYSFDFAIAFKDKSIMKARVRRAGVRVPSFCIVHSEMTAEEIVEIVGVPLVWKPLAGAGSIGVQVVRAVAELRELIAVADGLFECEEYISEDMFHIDAVVREGIHVFRQVSHNVNTPLAYVNGSPLGSFTVESAEIEAFSSDVVRALDLIDGVYHLEIMRSAGGGLVFIEIGLRPGGTEIVPVLRENVGIDLFGEAFRASLGLPTMLKMSAVHESHTATGWLIYPGPVLESRSGYRVKSLIDSITEVYWEFTVHERETLVADGGYASGPARYRLRSDSSSDVHEAILNILSQEPVAFEHES